MYMLKSMVISTYQVKLGSPPHGVKNYCHTSTPCGHGPFVYRKALNRDIFSPQETKLVDTMDTTSYLRGVDIP